MPRDLVIFKKIPCQNVFRMHENEMSAINKFLRFEERFLKKKKTGRVSFSPARFPRRLDSCGFAFAHVTVCES